MSSARAPSQSFTRRHLAGWIGILMLAFCWWRMIAGPTVGRYLPVALDELVVFFLMLASIAGAVVSVARTGSKWWIAVAIVMWLSLGLIFLASAGRAV